jgi:hypothetical protein
MDRIGGAWWVRSHDGRRVGFIPPSQDSRRLGLVVVPVEPGRFDPCWEAGDGAYYVGPDGRGGNPGRYTRFGTWYHGSGPGDRRGRFVRMPEAGLVRPGGGPTFQDGRHRYAWLRDHGFAVVPMVVWPHDAEAFRARFSPVD